MSLDVTNLRVKIPMVNGASEINFSWEVEGEPDKTYKFGSGFISATFSFKKFKKKFKRKVFKYTSSRTNFKNSSICGSPPPSKTLGFGLFFPRPPCPDWMPLKLDGKNLQHWRLPNSELMKKKSDPLGGWVGDHGKSRISTEEKPLLICC